jgi:hypothetical protein
MSAGNGRWLRTTSARALMFSALMLSLVLGVAFVVVNKPHDAVMGLPANGTPMTDEQSRDQVVEAARQVVTTTGLRDVTAGYVFLSCSTEHDPPYQAAVYLNFTLSESNSVGHIREIAGALLAHGWQEAPSMGEHFGPKLTRDAVTSTFHKNPDKAGFGTMRIYGECRNMADHRNDNPAWTDIAGQLS